MKILSILYLICTLLFLSCNGSHLDVVNVGFPSVNCIFDTDCTITVSDFSDEITLDGMSGSGFLQSRSWPIGEAGTAGEGLYAYLYRIHLIDMYGITFIGGVVEFSIDFGSVSKLDYNSDGNTDDVFVGTSGGMGSIGPSSVEKSGNRLIFKFNPGIAVGSGPGNGQSSFFFGVASTASPHNVTADIKDTEGNIYTLDARAPDFSP